MATTFDNRFVLPAAGARASRHERHADEEERWLVAAQAGDRRSFGRLYERYVRLVHGIVLSRVPATDVDDLVQDVFASALKRLPSFSRGAPFGPWIATIARNRAVDHLRLSRTSVPWVDSVTPSPAYPAEGLEALRCILALPEVYRETMVLRLVEGMRGPEIAERTGLTPGSVRVKLCRGMKLLRALLEEGQP